MSFFSVLVIFSCLASTILYQVSGKEEQDNINKLKSVLYTKYMVAKYSPYIDWERLHDEYVMAILNDDIQQGRELKRRKRRNKVKQRSNRKDRNKKNEDRMPDLLGLGTTSAAAAAALETRQNNDDALGLDDDNEVDDENDNEVDDENDVSVRQSEGIPIPDYQYAPCTDDATLPCPPSNLKDICTKGADIVDGGLTRKTTFTDCYNACRVSFCCVHDAPVQEFPKFAETCNTDGNCPGYHYCYIIWWKYHDTIGPATTLRIEGNNDDFFNVDADSIPTDINNASPEDRVFLQQVLFHHFEDQKAVIDAVTVDNTFNSDALFLNEEFWDSEFRLSDIP